MKGTKDQVSAYRWRHIDQPCSRCSGAGGVMYSSGATWRGGMGTASSAWDICDVCWGSGDESRPWSDQRKLEAELAAERIRSSLRWLWDASGLRFDVLQASIKELAEVVLKESRRRRAPNGIDLFNYARAAEVVAGTLQKLAKVSPESDIDRIDSMASLLDSVRD